MKNTNSNSLLYCLKKREINDAMNRNLQRKWHVTDSLINRLGLEKELEGHQGCVNCLEWNSKGQVLASASDDFQVILWDPFRHKKIHTIETRHHGNIFSVKFLPHSSDSIIITGAGDCQTHVHDINLNAPIRICNCPLGRVKRLATSPNAPFLYWSASEDGIVRQYDMRCQHECGGSGVANVLVYLRTHMGALAEAKCLAINPCRSELLAVGANDPFVRLYDRRMIKLTSIKIPAESNSQPHSVGGGSRLQPPILVDVVLNVEDNLPTGCVQYFVAGHLPVKKQNFKFECTRMPATYVTFSSNGVDLLVNLGGEQIYLFNTLRKSAPKSFNLPKFALPKECGGSAKPHTNGYSQQQQQQQHNLSGSGRRHVLPSSVDDLKQAANALFDAGEYSRAIRLYNEAIMRCADGPLLYGNRAAAYMKRNWNGDMYAALRDCHTTLAIDPNHVKAFFRLARCLFELDWRAEAKACLDAFKIRFPEHATSHACRALDKDISSPKGVNHCSTPKKEMPSSDIDFPDFEEDLNNSSITNQEWAWRDQAFDYEQRFYGHCNTTTDIKEANFFGSDGQYIMAGSDDGSIYFWERQSTNNVRILRGDSSIVNCLQPHPNCCLLASSGIDPVVRLWSPQPEDGTENEREVLDRDKAASLNQRRMKADPFDVVMTNMGFRLVNHMSDADGGESGEGTDSLRTLNCRTS